MSIADKLITIAENQSKVYDAGKLALLRASTHMNGTASGQAITLNDVSPVEHDVAVCLSSDTVTDFSQVNVKRYGRNLFNINATEIGSLSGYENTRQRSLQEGVWYVGLSADNYCLPSNVSYTLLNDSLTLVPVAGGYGLVQAFKCKPKQNYYLSFEKSSGEIVNVGFYDADGNHLTYKYSASSFTTPENCYLLTVCLTGERKVDNTFTKVQLSLAPIAEYEPYIEPTTHTATAGGTVEGVKSLSPSMTLTTDTDGVTIDCSYLRDIDTYIDNLTMSVAMTGGD